MAKGKKVNDESLKTCMELYRVIETLLLNITLSLADDLGDQNIEVKALITNVMLLKITNDKLAKKLKL
ncbi:MAG: hypothetical protein LUH02_01220 [Erysipelotrichaceae bacterium]|nr:hypothetical protein [Erysipelotrichaceae bacterium]